MCVKQFAHKVVLLTMIKRATTMPAICDEHDLASRIVILKYAEENIECPKFKRWVLNFCKKNKH
jgi:hypothetical protein